MFVKSQQKKSHAQSQYNSQSPLRGNAGADAAAGSNFLTEQKKPKQGGRSHYVMEPIVENVSEKRIYRKGGKSISANSDNKHGMVANLESISQAQLQQTLQQSPKSSKYDNMLLNLQLQDDGKVSWQGRPAIGVDMSDSGVSSKRVRIVKKKKVKKPKEAKASDVSLTPKFQLDKDAAIAESINMYNDKIKAESRKQLDSVQHIEARKEIVAKPALKPEPKPVVEDKKAGLYKNLQFNRSNLSGAKEDDRRFKHVVMGDRPHGDAESVDSNLMDGEED